MLRSTLSALVGAQRVLGVQLCYAILSYAVPDGNLVVLPKEHENTPSTSIRKQQIRLACASLGFRVPSTPSSRGAKYMFSYLGQIPSHKTGLSDTRSRKSQIQIRKCPIRWPLKDGLLEIDFDRAELGKFYFRSPSFFFDIPSEPCAVTPARALVYYAYSSMLRLAGA